MRPPAPAPEAQPHRLKISFRTSLIAVSLLTVLVASAAAHIPWLWISRENIVALVGQLNATIIEDVNKEVDDLFRSTEAAQATVLEMLDTGIVDINDRVRRDQLMFAFLKANPHFSWVSFGRPNGDFFGAQRRDEDSFRLVESLWDAERKEARRFEDYYAGDGEGVFFTQRKEKPSDYYAPKRQWYQRAVDKPGKHIWTDVYVFSSSRKPGVNTAITYDRDGQLLGVVSIAIELDRISRYLRDLKIGRDSAAFIVNRKGELIAFTEPSEVTVAPSSADENPKMKRLDSSWHPKLRLAQAAIDANDVALPGLSEMRQLIQTTPGGERYFVTVAPTRGRDWVVGTIVPEADFLTRIDANMHRLALTGFAAILVVGLLAAMVARVLFIRPLAQMTGQTALIERFDIKAIQPVPTRIRELDGLSAALVRMAHGLGSFRRYLPADLVGQLMAQGLTAEVGGERRNMSILFMDLENFTTHTERLGHRILPLLGDYLSDMSSTLIEQRGTIDKFIGDAVMAFWGAPNFNEEHPTDACRAALKCLARMEERRKIWASQGKPDLHVRIGVNSGRVVVGNIGSDDRLDYTVIGDPVNLASRLEGLNKAYGTRIMLGHATYELAKYDIVARRLDYVNVKGKGEKVAVYELLDMAEGEGDRQKPDWVIAYEQGLELYYAGDLAEARDKFQAANGLRGEDPPSLRFLKLCEDKLNPPRRRRSDAVKAAA
jgi:adenylate cyclase